MNSIHKWQVWCYLTKQITPAAVAAGTASQKKKQPHKIRTGRNGWKLQDDLFFRATKTHPIPMLRKRWYHITMVIHNQSIILLMWADMVFPLGDSLATRWRVLATGMALVGPEWSSTSRPKSSHPLKYSLSSLLFSVLGHCCCGVFALFLVQHFEYYMRCQEFFSDILIMFCCMMLCPLVILV